MTYHIFVSGRVQGVGYRRFAQKTADQLQLAGWTRNLWDGRVEIVASGDEKQLDDYCEILKKGPSFCQVHEVIVKVQDEKLEVNNFEIRPDAELK
jgi:acylphosphatase